MNLTSPGFEDGLEERAPGARPSGWSTARVSAVDRDAFLIRNEAGEIHAELAGRFRFTAQSVVDWPCVGDWVAVHRPAENGPAIIQEVLPRKSFLRRKSPGKSADFQMIAANIDVAFIVQGCHCDFSVPRLDRYLVMVNEGRIEPRIILSKTDMVSPGELDSLLDEIRRAGISAPVLPISNTSGAGLEAFRTGLAPGRTYCLLGSSGVGKTTLVNRLMGREAFETRGVSATGEGVHTTVRRQLLVLDGGAMLIDTPGMRELGLLGTGNGVDATFGDILGHSARCRFPDCTHTREPGCAVLAALKSGELGEDRYRSYQKLRKETEFHDLSYAEKRKKDKAFGRFVKTAMKQLRD